jgi:tungstate transport system ATP-binding protein
MRDTGVHTLSVLSSTSEPVVSAKNLCVQRSGKRILQDISLEIQTGGCTTLLGANGAGKSVLLRALHGLIPLSEGAVLWKGRPMTLSDRRAQAMVFQKPVLLRRSVRANLAFALKVRGIRGASASARLSEALGRAQLEDLAGTPARLLSGGEQQRLAMARALATGPEVLFLDEPTASLDPASTYAIETLISEASAAGVTIVLVTHDIGQARRLSDQVVFLHRGRMAETGSAEQSPCASLDPRPSCSRFPEFLIQDRRMGLK